MITSPCPNSGSGAPVGLMFHPRLSPPLDNCIKMWDNEQKQLFCSANWTFDPGAWVNMEPKVDRRIQRTRQLLQRAIIELVVAKGYEAISIQDITERANVARTTFYLHYANKDELLFNSVRDMIDELLERMQPGAAGNGAGFRHIAKNADFYRVILGKQGSPAFAAKLHDYLATVVRERVLTWASSLDKSLCVPIDFVTHYLVGAYVGTAMWWLENDMPCSAAEMERMLDQFAGAGLMGALATDVHEATGT